MNKTSIEWTHRPETRGAEGGRTWNPIHFELNDGQGKTGNMCTKISPGCKNCYAEKINQRWGNRLAYTVEDLTKGHFYLDEIELQTPLKTKKPCTIFVGDMFDLFHEAIPFEFVRRIAGIVNECQHHTFQLLTKRAARMREFSQWMAGADHISIAEWPRNVWLGVSVESQKYADERIPLLLQTPAAVRFLSVEPQLEAVSLRWKNSTPLGFGLTHPRHLKPKPDEYGRICTDEYDGLRELDWVICGGESGPKARPFNLAWAESLREQCKAAGVAFFMKQVGSDPRFTCEQINAGWHEKRKDRKGGDPSEWPESLRLREFPEVNTRSLDFARDDTAKSQKLGARS